MEHKNSIEIKNQKQKDGSPLLFLSLFLLLLAFFILLNSMAELEKNKTRQVITSVSSTFKTISQANKFVQIHLSTLGPVPEPEDVIDEINNLWVTAIPLIKTEIITPGREMKISMHVDDIFEKGSVRLREDKQGLINQTANVLSARIEGFTAIMTFVLGVDDLGSAKPYISNDQPVAKNTKVLAEIENDNTIFDIIKFDNKLEQINYAANSDLSFSRSTLFANTLISNGAPQSGVSIGIQRAATDIINIRFSIYPNKSVFNSFSGLLDDG